MHSLLIHKTQKGWLYNTLYTTENNGALRTLFCFYYPTGLFKRTLHVKLCGNTQTYYAFHVDYITFRIRTVHHFFVKTVTTATISLHTEKNSILLIPFAEGGKWS